MEVTHEYNVDLSWNNNRMGFLKGEGLTHTIEVATPPEFPKGMPGIWSPEHLFTAAVSSCLMTTFLAIAENSKLEFTAFDCKAKGKLEMVNGKYEISEVTLLPLLTIANGKDNERAMRVLQKSEAACLISNSVKSKIIFKPEIKVNDSVAAV